MCDLVICAIEKFKVISKSGRTETVKKLFSGTVRGATVFLPHQYLINYGNMWSWLIRLFFRRPISLNHLFLLPLIMILILVSYYYVSNSNICSNLTWVTHAVSSLRNCHFQYNFFYIQIYYLSFIVKNLLCCWGLILKHKLIKQIFISYTKLHCLA